MNNPEEHTKLDQYLERLMKNRTRLMKRQKMLKFIEIIM